jgi:hypothetical protein
MCGHTLDDEAVATFDRIPVAIVGMAQRAR